MTQHPDSARAAGPAQDVGLAASGISARFEPDCGFVGDLVIDDDGHRIAPLHRAPWIGEAMPPDLPPHLARLQGDFFCAPFGDGGGDAPVLHGWTANGLWQIQDRARDSAKLVAALDRDVQGARVTKRLCLRPGHPFLYQSHRFEGGHGPLSAANHAMLALPDGGLLSFSAKSVFRTPDTALEADPARGCSALEYPAASADPRVFPRADGGSADLTRYPVAPGHEDFVVGIEAGDSPLGWTAVVLQRQGALFLSLRDPQQLPMTMLWFSDGGRDYAPWSGRHRNCLGVEEGCAPHMLGAPGGLTLGDRLDIRHAIGAIAWPTEERVSAVRVSEGSLEVTGEGGHQRRVPFDSGHLFNRSENAQ